MSDAQTLSGGGCYDLRALAGREVPRGTLWHGVSDAVAEVA